MAIFVKDASLISELYIASCLMRLGLTCTITMGHTKEIDLVVTDNKGNIVTIDVKGLKNTTNWPLTNPIKRKSHFYVFVTFKDKIEDLSKLPEVYIVPSNSINNLLVPWAGRPDQTCIPYSDLKKKTKYLNAWNLIERALKNE